MNGFHARGGEGLVNHVSNQPATVRGDLRIARCERGIVVREENSGLNQCASMWAFNTMAEAASWLVANYKEREA